MSPLQRRCYDYIRGFINKHGVAPTYPEIQASIGLRSRGHAFGLVDRIVKTGLLERTAAGTRNLRLPGVDLSNVSTADLVEELNRRNP